MLAFHSNADKLRLRHPHMSTSGATPKSQSPALESDEELELVCLTTREIGWKKSTIIVQSALGDEEE